MAEKTIDARNKADIAALKTQGIKRGEANKNYEKLSNRSQIATAQTRQKLYKASDAAEIRALIVARLAELYDNQTAARNYANTASDAATP